jgi:hypothetical protein
MSDFFENTEGKSTEQSNNLLIENRLFAADQLLDFVKDKWSLIYVKEGGIFITSPRQKSKYIPAGKMFFIPPDFSIHICGKKTGSLIMCCMEKLNEVAISVNKNIILLHADHTIRYFFTDFLMNYEYGLKCRMYVENKLDELLFLVRNRNPYLTI